MNALPAEALAERVRSLVPGVQAQTTDNGQPWLLVLPADLVAVCRHLRDHAELAFDSLMDLTGYDLSRYPASSASDAIAVVYLLHSLRHRHKLTLKVLAPRANCAVPSVSDVWPAALYFEREVWDLLGVAFPGHPSLRRIMCPEDWVGHPLRKDYAYPAEYQGVSHLREGQRFVHGPRQAGDPDPAAAPAAPKAGHG